MLAALLAVRLLDEATSFVLPGTFESLRADLHLTYSQASSAFLAIAVGALAGSVATVAADYRSRRVIAAGGAFASGAASLTIAGADSYGLLLGGAFVVGAASTAMVDTSDIALADLAGDDLPHQLRLQNLWGSVGDLLGPAIVVAVAALGLPWRVSFVVGAGLLLLYGTWLATLPFPPPHPKEDGHRVGDAVASVLRDPVVWLAGAAGMLLGPLDEPLLAFLIAHLQQARGLAEAGATLIAALSVVGAFVGYATLRRRPSVLPVDAGLLAVATTLLVAAPGALTAGVASLLVGVFLVRVWVDLQARVLRVRPGQAGTVKAVVALVETAGWGLPLLAGAVADRTTVTAGLATYAAIAWALAGVALLLVRASAPTVEAAGLRRRSSRDSTLT
ncbi:MAG: MFS transporter [Actinomycetota bacterium]|nr:MFS transporter [Actinomycetota bacterium]